jgi:hypothetical protein
MAETKSPDLLPEKWMKGVAITTTILAVLTAIASSRTAYCVAQAQLFTALEGSKWSYYQAKSIKQNLAETQKKSFDVTVLGATTPDERALLEKYIKEYDENIGRYEKEKNEIKAEAEDVGSRNRLIDRQGRQYSMSVVFFQIGIMLSSVSALLKRKEMWVIGIIFGLIASVFLANGLFLIF